jgi:hypothetical protein
MEEILLSVLPAKAGTTISGASVRLGSDSSARWKLKEKTTCLRHSSFFIVSH